MRIERQRVLVSGGAGFIGSHLVDALIEGDNDVFVVDDFSTGKIENLDQHRRNPKLHVIEADLTTQLPSVRPLFKETQTVFHLACLGVRHSIHSPLDNHAVNASATLALLEGCRNAAVK